MSKLWPFKKTDPGHQKKAEIKKVLERVDKEVRRTRPCDIDAEVMQYFGDKLLDTKNQIIDLRETNSNRCRDLIGLHKGVELVLVERWKASPHNPQSPWYSQRQPGPRNKSEANERTSVSQVNEKVPNRILNKNYGGTGRNDIAKVHSGTPEVEKVTAIYHHHTTQMVTAGASTLQSIAKRDYSRAANSYAAATKTPPAVMKPPAVTVTSDFKIHSHKDSPNKISQPLQPEYRGNVQEYSDVDRKMSSDQTNHNLRSNKFLHDQQNVNSNENVQVPANDGYETKIVSPNVHIFFKHFSELDQRSAQFEQNNQTSFNADQHTNRYSEHNQVQDPELTSDSDSNQFEASTSKLKRPYVEHDDNQHVQRHLEQSPNQFSERNPVQNVESTSSSGSRQCESSVEQYDISLYDRENSLIQSFQRYQAQDDELMTGFDSRQIESSNSNVKQVTLERNRNNDLIPGSNSRQYEPSDRNVSKNVRQYTNRNRECSKHSAERDQIQPKDFNESQRSNRNVEPPTNSYQLRSRVQNNQLIDQAKQLEKNQVRELSNQNISVDNFRPMSYASVASKQLSQQHNVNIPKTQHRHDCPNGDDSSQENPNSILQNISYERRPDQELYQSPASSQQQTYQRVYHPGHHPRSYYINNRLPQPSRQAYQQQNQQYHHTRTVEKPAHEKQPEPEPEPEEIEEEVEMAEEPKIVTDEIEDFSVHFQNDDLKNNKGVMPRDEYIALVRSKAEKFEPQIEESEGFEFTEFFIIEENMNQFVNFLDQTKTRDDEELTRQKIEVIRYIQGLQARLDKKRLD